MTETDSTATLPNIVTAHDEVSAAIGRADAARCVFVDFARALAILMMLQGHTLHVVLAVESRIGTAFHVWSFFRGLTSGLFLLLSGFAFTIATHRRWADHLRSRATIGRRFRRFGFFLLLGYALHFPMAKIVHLYGMSHERWRSFLIVDVLQCIAVTLAALQLLVFVARTPRRYAIVAASGCTALVALTPAMWAVDWTESLPMMAAAYLSAGTGSLFPLFPWSAYILLGAVTGELYSRWGTLEFLRFVNSVLLGAGVGLLTVSLVWVRVPEEPFGPADWSAVPTQFLLRVGLVLTLLGVVAHLSQFVSRPAFLIEALARESLTIYAVHLCLVYGSVWNPGLRQLVGPTLTLWPALACVIALWTVMGLVACAWLWCKHRRPRAAHWVRVATAGFLLGWLL